MKLVRWGIGLAVGAGGLGLVSGADISLPGWLVPVVSRGAAWVGGDSGGGPASTAQASLVYYDSDAFDLELGRLMGQRPTQIHLLIEGGTNLDQLPRHLDGWLVAIAYTGGTVRRRPVRAEVSSFGLDGWERIGETLTELFVKGMALALKYQAARHYDAWLLYEAGSGRIGHVVFRHR